ncbi:MAG: GH25 family lysozyme [Suilimivivens sp.]
MRLPDESDESGMSTPVIYTIVVVSALILIILACVLISNNQNNSNRLKSQPVPTPSPVEEPENTMEFAEGQQDIEALYNDHKLRADDLDFWDMYDAKEPVIVEEESPSPASDPSPEASPEPTDEEKAADGKHVLVSYKDGTEEWLAIDEDLPVRDYDFTKMKTTNGKMTYYEGNKKLSRLGVELSEDSGEVDFETLREAGIDFVLLKIGGRGYGTGLISIDKNFVTNMEAAQKAGLEIGVYFCSQAVTVEEAVEEAKFVTDNLIPYQITYPVAFRMDSITNDNARTDILDAEQKTQIVEAFLNDVEGAGHEVILYGDKDWLLTEILPSELLKEYDVWLADASPIPDYPYQFKMWEYAMGAVVPGVEKEVNYTISFVDYTKR